MTDALPILYSFRRCPYAMRARMALAVSGQTCALREVVLRNKPAEMIDASPKATVPILVLQNGNVLDESYIIMKWALDRHDPDHWLQPETGDLDAIDALVEQIDGDFKHHLDRYKYPNRYDNIDPLEQRAAGVAILEGLDRQLSGPKFLFGDRISLADVAIVPFVRQFANTDRDWFDKQPFQFLHEWLNGLLDSDLFKSIMKKYPAWATGDVEPHFPAPTQQ